MTAGIVIANDVQEKRLWVLNDAIQRTGATSAVIVRKVGQWYQKQMTERFDRVLCDAPCTAQGTARKDSDALRYCSLESIAKMARLQRSLLESAVHACRVGGRIVYSTCTLTPEENEAVVLSILERFGDCLQVIDPRDDGVNPSTSLGAGSGEWKVESAIEDSARVQQWLRQTNHFQLSPSDPAIGRAGTINYPLLRLWPQTYDTEGFFCAVLRKVKPTRHPEPVEFVSREARPLTKAKRSALEKMCSEQYGTTFLLPGDLLIERGQQVLLTTAEAFAFALPVREYAQGVPFAKILPENRFRLASDAVQLRGHLATKGIMDLSAEQLAEVLAGKDIACDAALHGDVLLRHRHGRSRPTWHRGMTLGLSLAKGGVLMNRLPRWVVKLGYR